MLDAALRNLGVTDTDRIRRVASKFDRPGSTKLVSQYAGSPSRSPPAGTMRAQSSTMRDRRHDASKRIAHFSGREAQNTISGITRPQTDAAEWRLALSNPTLGGSPSRSEDRVTEDKAVHALRQKRMVQSRLLHGVVTAVNTPAKLGLLRSAVRKLDSDRDGFLTTSEARRAFATVGVSLSDADAETAAAAVGASVPYSRSGTRRVHAEKLLDGLNARLADVQLADEEVRSSSATRLLPQAARERTVARTMAAASPTSGLAGASSLSRNRQYVLPGTDAAADAAARPRRSGMVKPGEGFMGVREVVFSDEPVKDDANKPSVGSMRAAAAVRQRQLTARRDHQALVADKLLRQVERHLSTKPSLRSLNAAMLKADLNKDGLLSLSQFKDALGEIGFVLSADDTVVLSESLGASRTLSPTSRATHVDHADVLKYLHGAIARSRSSAAAAAAAATDTAPTHTTVDGSVLKARGAHAPPAPSPFDVTSVADPSAPVYDAYGNRMHSRSVHNHAVAYASDAAGATTSARRAAERRPMRRVGDAKPFVSQDLVGDSLPSARETVNPVKQKLRDALPAGRSAARSQLRHTLNRVDDDHDGMVSCSEMTRAARAMLGVAVSSTDVATMLAEAVTATEGSHGFGSSRRVVDNDAGRLSIDQVTDWILDLDGGHQPTREATAWKWLAEHGGHDRVQVGSQIGVMGTTSGAMGTAGMGTFQADKKKHRMRRHHHPDRSFPGSPLTAEKQRFAQFRVAWESRHGSPAQRELKLDAARSPPGPTWNTARPEPFRVLHPSQPPPPPGSPLTVADHR